MPELIIFPRSLSEQGFNSHKPEILIIMDPATIPASMYRKILMIKRVRKVLTEFRDNYCAGATRPAGRYTGK